MVSVSEYWFHRINTVQRDNTYHMYNTSTFFLIFFFVRDVYEKIKVGFR